MQIVCDLKGNVFLPPGDTVVLTTGPLVGLGDHAIYSTLPKRFKELGYTVLLDKDCQARNDEILDVFWGQNPHIDGLTDKKPNAGYVRQGLFYEIANKFPLGSIAAMERAHGLPPPYSLAPIVNYTPKPFPLDVSRYVLFDFSSVSSKIADRAIAEFVGKMMEKYGGPFLQLLMPKWASLEGAKVQSESVAINSIYEYLDALASARGWIGSEAGGQSLAAAARGEHKADDLEARLPCTVLATPKTFNSRGYTYAGIDYRVTSQAVDQDSDFWKPTEVLTHRYELACAFSLANMRAMQKPEAVVG